jgi:hypothetical protein
MPLWTYYKEAVMTTPEPTLQDAEVTFYTGNTDDEDRDTNVTIIVCQQDGTVAARISDNFGLFPNNGNNGPCNLVTTTP